VTGSISPVSRRRAGILAAEGWGLDGELEPLAGEFDFNFLIRARDGRRFVLKVSPVNADRESLECQIAALRHLQASPVAPLVQRPVSTTDGLDLLAAVDDVGNPRWVRLVSYLEGVPLVTHDRRPPGLLEEIGAALARLDLALKDFDHPGARRKLKWDLPAMPALGCYAELIPDPARRKLVEDRIARFNRVITPRLAELEFGVIYNDANDRNLLVRTDDDGAPRLGGIIDFGDMLHTAVVAELAIACAYLMLDRDDPLADAAHVIRGYHAVRPLTAVERELLPDFIIARLVASVLMSARGRHRDPGNSYLQISEAPVWRLLERMTMSDRDRIHDAVRRPGRGVSTRFSPAAGATSAATAASRARRRSRASAARVSTSTTPTAGATSTSSTMSVTWGTVTRTWLPPVNARWPSSTPTPATCTTTSRSTRSGSPRPSPTR